METLLAGRTYAATITGTHYGERFYRDIEFTASRDQEVEPFIRGRESTPDQDRVFKTSAKFGSIPELVVSGSIKEKTMDNTDLPQLKAEDLKHDMVILDPEGNEATVIRIQRVDHQRGRLHTDAGIAIVPLDQKFPVIAGADPS